MLLAIRRASSSVSTFAIMSVGWILSRIDIGQRSPFATLLREADQNRLLG
jgi:hypothetical protein